MKANLGTLLASAALCAALAFSGTALAAKHQAAAHKASASSHGKASKASKSGKGGKITKASHHKMSKAERRKAQLAAEAAERKAAMMATPGYQARNAFYSGDTATAYKLAVDCGERWVAGLSAFRLKTFTDARTQFEAVAYDAAQDEWLRAGAFYWAARSAIAEGSPELAPAYLEQAAERPWTFYGMIAEAQLGREPSLRFDAPVPVPSQASVVQTASQWRLQTMPAANDPIANLMIKVSAADEARLPFADTANLVHLASSDTTELPRMLSDAGPRIASDASPAALPFSTHRRQSIGFDPSDYPAPALSPMNGFTVQPAMVYALVRQESRFNPQAVSRVGAVGLMQLMPGTAALTTGDESLKRNTSPLRDPAYNLRVGQDYFIWLLEHGVGDDLISAVAAYNAGPGALLKTQTQLGGEADALMLMESLPAQETRAYVEKVLAGYWMYRRQFGEKTPSLEALAGGAARIPMGFDY